MSENDLRSPVRPERCRGTGPGDARGVSTTLDTNGMDSRSSFAPGAGRLAGMAGAVLGWTPDAFWRATPAELACVVRALAGDGEARAAPPDAATIARLKEAFPDDRP